MRSDWIGSALVVLVMCFGGGCKAGSECGDVQAKCEIECGGGAADNVCFTHLCSEEQLICYCKPCEVIQRDMSATVDLRQKD